MDELKQLILNKQLRGALISAGYRDATVTEMGGDIIYTNEKIKQSFIHSISDQDTFKPILSTIITLIETDVIIPAHVKSGFLNKIIYMFFRNKRKFAQSRFCMAFYSLETGKIVVLVENIENIQYWKKEEALSLVTLHEFQHMTATEFPTSFMRVHAKYLILFFKKLFFLYFDISLSDKEVFKIVNWIHVQTETKKGRTTLGNHTINQYFSLMWNTFKPHVSSTEKLKRQLYKYFTILLTYLRNPSLYAQLVHSKDQDVLKLYLSMKESYKALKIMQHVDSLCIQELFFPGEVICVESEYNTQARHFKLISQIKT